MSCNKDNGTSTPTAVGRWKFKQQIIQVYVNGNIQNTVTFGPSSGDYFEFKANGTAEAQFRGMYEPLSYAISGNDITINQKKGKINTLTSSEFSYTLPDTISATSYTKTTWNLYK